MDLNIFNIQKLTCELVKFGLNPKEWLLVCQQLGPSKVLHFENKADKNFTLVGTLEKRDHGFSLSELSLFSI